MYEGKNIHFSAVDNKPLCSYSSKICKQRRLNGYAFCLRHVLEDSSAPFKQCSFNTKNGQRCINPIPKSRNAEYCNTHMQHLGLAPTKRGKDVIKDVKEETPPSNGLSGDNKLRLEERLKNKFNLHQKEPGGGGNGFDDDPYAFHDPDPPKLVGKTSPIIKPSPPPAKSSSATLSKALSPQIKTSTILGLSSASPEHNHVVPNKVAPTAPKPADAKGGTSSIAKLYPELAEKLERVRTKTDPKAKTSTKSSRTMNRLQTKIAQNKIKDKLKKTQGHSINSSCSTTPEQPGTPVAPQVATSTPTVEHKPLISPVASSRLYASEATTNISWTPNAVTTSFTQQMAPLSQSWPPATPPNIAMQFPMGPHLPLGKDNTHTPSLPYVPPYTAPDIKVPPFIPSVTPHPGVTSLQTSLDSLSSSQPFPNQFPFQQHTPSTKTLSRPSHLMTRAKRPKNVLSESEAKRKLKRHSAVKVYAYHASRRMNNIDLLPIGVDSSDEDSDFDDDFPSQHYWVTNSSDEEVESEDDIDEEITSNIRKTKLGLYKSKLRRQFVQLRKTHRGNTTYRSHNVRALQALIQSARHCSDAATKTLKEIKLRANKANDRDRHESQGLCLYTGSEQKKEECHEAALPFTNHCINHIMYNIDQQMFDYCTAKFSDNTQCCIPVFDVRHELPLCPEHAAKADNYQKNHEPKPKKPRKKTKPSALTRPPKKGKKKKNQKRNVRPQKPTPPLSPTGNSDLPPVFTPEASGTSAGESSPPPAEAPSSGEEKPPTPPPAASVSASASTAAILDANLPKEGELVDLGGDLEESFSPGAIGKDLDLPMDSEQAAKFLDEHDLHDVLNKLPDEAFDLITNKNGEFMSTNEAELLEQAIAEASKVEFVDPKETIEKLSRHAESILIGETPNDDELTKQIADSLLNQNMGSPAGSLSDDLSTDNLNALASSLSANDLKSISQVLTTSVINSALGSDAGPTVSQSSMGVEQNRMLEQLHHGLPVSHSGMNAGHVPAGPLPQVAVNQQPAAIGNFPIIQAQLAQGPMLHNQQGPISTGAITSISVNGAPMSSMSMSKSQELFSSIVGNSSPMGISRLADNVPSSTVAFPSSLNPAHLGAPHVVQLGGNHLQVQQGLDGILVPMANPAAISALNSGQPGVPVSGTNVDMKMGPSPNVNFQNGLPPINTAFHGQAIGPGGMGVKLAYPVQMLPGGIIGGANNQSVAISSQSPMTGQQLYTISTSLPQSEQTQIQQTLPNV